jgi:hypothetical protein
MAVRLVTAPKAYAWTKDAHGNVYNISNYITAGKVDRLIDSVSTAQLTLRNPNKIFTVGGEGGEPIFHPMDPITIFLERVKGFPIRVFTGFLDETPYYQMFPGTVKLTASCTLKRLLYVFFDPALPYFESFLMQFGWTPRGDGTVANFRDNSTEEGAKNTLKAAAPAGILHESKAETENRKAIEKAEATLINTSKSGKTSKKLELQDKSIGRLLWALIYYVAQIRDEDIYIEGIPEEVSVILKNLATGFEEGQRLNEEELGTFLKEVIGTSTQGSGNEEGGPAGATGNLKDTGKVVRTMKSIAEKYGLPPAMVICTALCEESFSQASITGESGGALGWFQFQFEGAQTYTPYSGKGNDKSYNRAEAQDTAIATDAFCKAAAYEGKQNPSFKSEANWNAWAQRTQGSDGYPGRWSGNLAKAKSLLSQYGNSGAGGTLKNQTEENEGLSGEPEETQRGSTDESGKTSGGTRTRIKAMEEEADKITARHYHYAFGGGHSKPGVPSMGTETESGGSSVLGFDCSGSSAAVLAAGGLVKNVEGSGSFGAYQSAGTSPGPAPAGAKPSVTVYYNSAHAFLIINGRYFSTSHSNPGGGAGWQPGTDGQPLSTFKSFHYTPTILQQPYNKAAPPLTGGSSGNEEGEGGSSDPLVAGKVSAFTSELAFPSVLQKEEAMLFTGQRALINDIPLLPFVQQVAKASLRHFMSLPNGNFYAFYPDYFGELGAHEPYWLIYNTEILDGGINLNDMTLVTHVYAVGDNVWPQVGGNEDFFNKLKSAGTVTIFNAFGANGIVDMSLANNKYNNYNNTPLGNEPLKTKDGQTGTPPSNQKKKGPELAGVMDVKAAQDFLQRYGARPLVEEFPMVRSPLYEMLMAYQSFCLAWSRQFVTPFRFTFMPELFPGGKVGFPEHGIQMYIEEVVHEWDMEVGYTTDAKLCAPSLYRGKNSNTRGLPEHMVNGLAEPIHNATELEKQAKAQIRAEKVATGKSIGKRKTA